VRRMLLTISAIALASFGMAVGMAVPGMAGTPCTIQGDSGPNTLVGTLGHDVIYGGGGNDRLEGRGGNFTQFGETLIRLEHRVDCFNP
jgi:hemolysin type calcium-binding protein